LGIQTDLNVVNRSDVSMRMVGKGVVRHAAARSSGEALAER